MYQVIKRDGIVTAFDIRKISSAITKAFEALNKQYHSSIIDLIALRVTADFEGKVKDGKISDCTFTTYEADGTLKDEAYGKEDGRIANKDYYNKAQKGNAACAEYASMLVQNGQLDGIDSISGATINYNEFKEAVELALEQAQE